MIWQTQNSHLIQLHTDETKSPSKAPFNFADPAIKTFVKIAAVALVMTRTRRVGSWILTSCQPGRVRIVQQEGEEEEMCVCVHACVWVPIY